MSKHHIIVASLFALTLGACNLDNIKDSKVQRLTTERDVKGLIDNYIKKTPTFGTDQAAEALGNLGDKQAVEPLMTLLKTPIKSSASSAEIKASAAAALALGKLQDTRAVKSLVANVKHPNRTIANAAKTGLKEIATANPQVINQLLVDFKKDDANAVAALGAIGKPALKAMLIALKEPDARIRTNAASVLYDIGDPTAIEPLTKNLTDLASSPMVALALEKLNWQPQSTADKVYFLIAKRKGEELRHNWEMTKNVLLKDLASNQPRKIDYALYSFIGIGGKDTTETLVKVLKEQGHKNLALTYINSGEPTLEKAAYDWAKSRGYTVIKTTQKDQSVKWGSF